MGNGADNLDILERCVCLGIVSLAADLGLVVLDVLDASLF